MAYVIAEPCHARCSLECVSVCPVDCIHGPMTHREVEAIPIEQRPASLRMYIDPDECIDCGACESECPVSAIVEDDALPPEWEHHRERNADFFAARR
ncbi:MAG: 4Fe-4S binding protein [Polyangiales bacterium]